MPGMTPARRAQIPVAAVDVRLVAWREVIRDGECGPCFSLTKLSRSGAAAGASKLPLPVT